MELIDIKNIAENKSNIKFNLNTINEDEDKNKDNNIIKFDKNENKKTENIFEHKYFELNLLQYTEAREQDKRSYL